MSLEQFSRHAILVTVVPVMGKGGQIRLEPSTPMAEAALIDLHRECVRVARAANLNEADLNAWATRKADELLATVFSDDVWYGQIPGGRPVILVKSEPAQQHGEQVVLRKTHLAEVMEAARNGQEIPPSVAEEYAVELSQLYAERNLPVS